MVTVSGVTILARYYEGENPSASTLKTYVGKMTFDEAEKCFKSSKAAKAEIAKAKTGKLNVTEHLALQLRKNLKKG